MCLLIIDYLYDDKSTYEKKISRCFRSFKERKNKVIEINIEEFKDLLIIKDEKYRF